MDFGDKVKIVIAMKNITQQELADMLNTSRITVNTWVSTRQEPKLQHVVNFAKLFPDINADWILDRSEKMYDEKRELADLQKKYQELFENYHKLKDEHTKLTKTKKNDRSKNGS